MINVAGGGTYKVKFRRRREGKTNYKKRAVMVISGKNRLVVRRTNNYIIAQIMQARPEGDVTLVSATSKELRKFGWKGGLKNMPAAYLTGLLLGKRAVAKGIEEAVLDVGLHVPIAGSRIFAVAKGAIDADMDIPQSEDSFPDPERLSGKHIADYAAQLASNEEELKRKFSKYFKDGLNPSDIVNNFEEVKKKIEESIKASTAEAEA